MNVYWNALFVKQHASGKYICQSAHDDWFIDKDFIKSAVEELKKNSDCFIAAASFCEESESGEININEKYDWCKINEIDFIKSIWNKNNYMLSSSVLDFEKLKKMNYFDMFISKPDAIKINIEPDEAHLPYNLLSFNSHILISSKIVAVRGTPELSYSRSKKWKLIKNKSVFFNIYNIYKFYKKNSNIELANLYKNLIIKKFSVEKIYFELFLFLKSFDSFKILIQSYLYFHFKKYKYILKKIF